MLRDMNIDLMSNPLQTKEYYFTMDSYEFEYFKKSVKRI